MVFLRLKGGLGNQVFQVVYALLKFPNNKSIFVDVSLFAKKFENDYAGGEILVDKVLSQAALKKLRFIQIGHKVSSVFWKFAKKLNPHFLDDYFSDARYFPKDIDYREFFDLECSYDQLKVDSDSVIVHVRKGDYTNSVNSQIYFNCDVNYFEAAIKKMSEKLSAPKFYIMSNDNDWVRNHFQFLGEYKILEIDDPILSFKVMCKFSNFIISNSTFSWWPAFLTKSTNVFVPKKWYLDEKKNINIYPDHWVKV